MRLCPILALILLSTAVSCGGGSDAPATSTNKATCGSVTACGGNPVGFWHSVDSCLSLSGSPNLVCSGVSFHGQGVKTVATVDYRADGTFTLNRSFMGKVDGQVPASCLAASTLDLTCDLLAGLLAGKAGVATCTSRSDGGCDCSMDFTAPDTDRIGTYVVANNILTLSYTESGATKTESYDLCVKGNELLASPSGGELQIVLPSIGNARFGGDTVFAK